MTMPARRSRRTAISMVTATATCEKGSNSHNGLSFPSGGWPAALGSEFTAYRPARSSPLKLAVIGSVIVG